MKNFAQDDNTPMGKSKAYCTYHQWKGHSTKFGKQLEVSILDIIAKGKYHIEGTKTKQDPEVHMVSADKDICASLRSGHPRNAPNLITEK